MIFGTILPLIQFSHVYVSVDRDGEVEPSMTPTPLMIGVLEFKWFGQGVCFMYGEVEDTPREYQ